MKSTLFIILFYLTIVFTVSAQNYRIQNFDMNNGLPSNAVRVVMKDSKGFIWIGTDGGLCKYDGKNFDVYTTSNGLSGNKIWAIEEDKNGLIWIGTYDNGISTYNGKHYKPYKLNDTINQHVRCSGYLPEFDCIGFGTDSGIITITNGKAQYFNPENKNSSKERLLIISVQETINSLVFHSYYYVPSYEYFPKDKILKVPHGYDQLGVNNIFGAAINNCKDTVVAFMGGEVIVLKKNENVVFQNTGMITSMVKDKFDNVWLAGWDGTQSGKTGGVFKLKDYELIDYTNKLGIESRFAWTIFNDSASGFNWIGTLDKGLYVSKNSFFEYYDLNLPKITINDFIISDSITWIAADDYLIKKTDTDTVFFDKKYFSWIAGNTNAEHLKNFFQNQDQNLDFLYLGFDNANQLYVATNYAFYRYNKKNDNFSFAGINRFPFFFTQNEFYSVGWSRLRKYKNPNDFETSVELTSANYPYDVSRIYSHGNEKWFASWSNGLYVFDNGEFTNLNEENDKLDSNVKDVCFGKNGNIYVAQSNCEILVCRYDNGEFVVLDSYDNKSGIIGNNINWVAISKNGFLMLGTDKGLNLILNPDDRKTRKIKFFNEKDGYCARNSTVAKNDTEGNVWIDTDKGLLKINADALAGFKVEDNLRTDSVQVNEIIFADILRKDNVSLRYSQNFISFFFSKPNFSDPEKDVIYYRLLGQTDKWIEAAPDGRIDFFALSPDDYEFQIRCFNKTNGEFGKTISHRFTIQKPWWATFWFIGLTILLLSLVIIWIIRQKIKKIKEEAEKKTQISKQIAELEMKALQSQMNPHFVFNSINSIQNFVLGNQTDDALKYLAHFSQLLRSVLNFASLKYISIAEELEFLDHYTQLEKMRFDNGFAIDYHIENSINPKEVLIPPMVLQPIIENSIKHGLVYKNPQGKIAVSFDLCGEILCCTVSDNGIGPEQASKKQTKAHTSKALGIIRERLKILYSNPQTSIEINDQNPGCKVTLKFELKFVE